MTNIDYYLNIMCHFCVILFQSYVLTGVNLDTENVYTNLIKNDYLSSK